MRSRGFGMRQGLHLIAAVAIVGAVAAVSTEAASGHPASSQVDTCPAPGSALGYQAVLPRCRPRPAPPPPATGRPDATLSKTARGPLPWRPGAFQWFDFTVTNQGTASTLGPATVSDALPDGLTLTSEAQYTGDGWSCVRSGGDYGFTCTYSGPLAPGASTPPLAVRVQVDPALRDGTINFATVATPGDTNPNNDSASSGYIRVEPPAPPPPTPVLADFEISIFGHQTLTEGMNTEYEVLVVNAPDGPTGVGKGSFVVTHVVPAGVTVVSVRAGNYSDVLDWRCTLPGPDPTRPTVVTCTHRPDASATETTMQYDQHANLTIGVKPAGVCPPNVPAVVRILTASVSAPANGDADMADNRTERYATIFCSVPIVPNPAATP